MTVELRQQSLAGFIYNPLLAKQPATTLSLLPHVDRDEVTCSQKTKTHED